MSGSNPVKLAASTPSSSALAFKYCAFVRRDNTRLCERWIGEIRSPTESVAAAGGGTGAPGVVAVGVPGGTTPGALGSVPTPGGGAVTSTPRSGTNPVGLSEPDEPAMSAKPGNARLPRHTRGDGCST